MSRKNGLKTIFKCFALEYIVLTVSFFENGPIPTPTKLQNPTNVGSGDLGTTQNQNLSPPQRDFYFLTIQAHTQKKHICMTLQIIKMQKRTKQQG